MRLTTKAIKAFKHSDGWDVRWDDAVPGLGVRVYPRAMSLSLLKFVGQASLVDDAMLPS